MRQHFVAVAFRLDIQLTETYRNGDDRMGSMSSGPIYSARHPVATNSFNDFEKKFENISGFYCNGAF